MPEKAVPGGGLSPCSPRGGGRTPWMSLPPALGKAEEAAHTEKTFQALLKGRYVFLASANALNLLMSLVTEGP